MSSRRVPQAPAQEAAEQHLPNPPPRSTSREPHARVSSAREAMLAEVRALAGATLQKLWLATPQLLALQLRVPGRTVIVAVDAERALALLADERPASPESALKAQATLRAAMAGAQLRRAELVLAADAPESARQSSLRLSFDTPSGPRALLADPRAHALCLAAPSSNDPSREQIVWSAPGAVAAFRPGSQVAPFRLAPEEPRESDAAPAGGARALASQALEENRADRFAEEKQQLVRSLRARLQKIARTRQAVERDAAQAAVAIDARRFAELLLPHQSRIPRGAKEAVVPDWSQLDESGAPAQITIALDPALGAAENASRMLKKAHRYSAAQPRIAARRAEVAGAQEALEALLASAEADLAALRALSSRSRAADKPTRAQPLPSRGAPVERLPYRAFRTSSGARVLVGRSAKDNDTLTLKWARGEDLWLHARGVQGSHVILLAPGPAPDADALLEAAMLAAHFSTARGADGAEVSWTRRKHVRKGRGQAPGAVTFSQEKTLRVRLDEARLQALLAREE